jgi:serine/threonine protein kinase
MVRVEMHNREDQPTRIQTTGAPQDATRVVRSEADEATRVVSREEPATAEQPTRIASPPGGGDEATRVIEQSDEHAADQGLDPPTRLAIESARRMQQQRTFQPGSLIKGRFQLVEELGRGGMGVVFSARDLVQEEVGERNSLIAIKLLSDDFKDHPDALRMLQQETKKARELAHPNIITVYDFDRDDETVYMTMELMSGQSLKDYLKEHQYETPGLDEVLPIIRGIAEGLKYAHQRNIIHSDLKPANIFLTDKGVKILDFGIARAVMQAEPESDRLTHAETGPSDRSVEADSSLSETGEAFALTPSYASLEMFYGDPPDPTDDIYAFACICYQLLVNKHPYRKRSAREAFEKSMTPARIEGLKDAQWHALLAGLALQREKRAASVDEFIDGLLPPRREPWKYAAFALLLLASLVSVYFLTRPPEIVAPSLFENPPPAAEMTPELQAQVTQMLEVADVHMMVGRLLSPPGSNALDEYRKVLELNPYNRQAIAGLRALLEELTRQARSALAAGEVERAGELVKEGLAIHTENEALQSLSAELETLLK